jgi:hypothetical protein
MHEIARERGGADTLRAATIDIQDKLINEMTRDAQNPRQPQSESVPWLKRVDGDDEMLLENEPAVAKDEEDDELLLDNEEDVVILAENLKTMAVEASPSVLPTLPFPQETE